MIFDLCELFKLKGNNSVQAERGPVPRVLYAKAYTFYFYFLLIFAIPTINGGGQGSNAGSNHSQSFTGLSLILFFSFFIVDVDECYILQLMHSQN